MSEKKLCEAFALNPGDQVEPVFQWNEDRTDLVKVGEVNIQEQLNERAKGTTVYDLIERFRGPDNVFDAYPDKGEGISDVTLFPETSGDITLMTEAADRVQAAQASQQQKQADKDIQAQIEELKNQLAALEAEKPQEETK